MSPTYEYAVPNPDTVKQLGQVLAQCFTETPERSRMYCTRVGMENLRLLRQEQQVIGGLAVLPMGQWWGGHCVPMTGIAAVGIAPNYRGTGAAIALLQNTLRDIFAQGAALSVLYPAAQALYRKLGYEQAGLYQSWSVSTKAIQIRDRSRSIQSISPIMPEAFHPLQRQYAQANNGHLDRYLAIWQEHLNAAEGETIYAYQVGTNDAPEGYIIFSQQHQGEETVLRIRDWAVLTPEAGRSLWTFLAQHRSQIGSVHWRGGAIDPLTLLLPEQTAQLGSSMRWMLRIVNVRSALEQRGYGSGMEAELHLDIHDDLLSENTGKVVLSVAQGQGQVTSGGTGNMKLDIRGLAPLYSGLFTPKQLQRLGYLEAPDSVLAIATSIFAGESPWLPDFF